MSLCELSKSFVFTILTKNFGMSFVCARWGPRLLSDNHKKRRMQTSKAFLQKFKAGDKSGLTELLRLMRLGCITLIPKPKEFQYVGTPGFSTTKESKGFKKHRKTDVHIFADQHRMILTHAVPSGQTVNVSYYSRVNILQAICHI